MMNNRASLLRIAALFGVAMLIGAVFWSIGLSKIFAPQPAHFAVISDPHIYDRALGSRGSAFASDFAQDVKLVVESEALFSRALQLLEARKPHPAFLLIPGDLTKDGEELSHRMMASYLSRLKAAGMAIYVIPGNHDIENPSAKKYMEQGTMPARSIDAHDFASIYAQFGYAQALARDPDSLSYIAEPVPGYWLFAIDSCRYRENTTRRIDGGRIGAKTLAWILAHLAEARQAGKTVIAMLHHGLLEHHLGQGSHFPDLTVENWETVSRTLAAAGMNLVFTGHAHTQDITRKDWDEGTFLVDVQTGSLVTYPNPYRIVTLDRTSSQLSIQSIRVDYLPARDIPTDGKPFADFSRDSTYQQELGIVQHHLTKLTKLPTERRNELDRQVADAILANYAGDELPTLRVFKEALALSRSGQPDEAAIGSLMLSLWHDLPPADNTLTMVMRGKPADPTRNRRLSPDPDRSNMGSR